MASCVSWHQHKRRLINNKVDLFWSWFRSTIPLVVVLGLTWIIGIIVVEVEALVPLAYIYTIMVAFQGLFIFLILVVFPKNVREEYLMCFKSKARKKVSTHIMPFAFLISIYLFNEATKSILVY